MIRPGYVKVEDSPRTARPHLEQIYYGLALGRRFPSTTSSLRPLAWAFSCGLQRSISSPFSYAGLLVRLAGGAAASTFT